MSNNLQKKENNIIKQNIPKLSSEKHVLNSGKEQINNFPQDIFADTETTANINPPDKVKPDIFNPIEKELKLNNNIDIHQKQALKNKKIFLLLFGVIIFLFLILFGIWSFKYLIPKSAKLEKNSIDEDLLFENEDNKENENNKIDLKEDILLEDQNNGKTQYFKEDIKENLKEEKNINIDSDQDGLNDEEEKKLGTDPNKVDTDQDKLFDREEIYIYKTDPLNPDSDGDSYLDGDEVLKGYNPLGDGKLYNIKSNEE